ncbi:G-protein coupled receptor Mth2-like [Sitodiplosis mosellana]|uniref:G-protein coupled receptor Mth2-like n=1 Tax=Sitodiplosis mosellana TaxID=263140 RepID=UPI002443F350|nr:G-protein coupled receptor Mth2-like [Sitodiplosis mosellana]
MCCAFRSLPLVASLWLIITFRCTCFASIDVTPKTYVLPCNSSDWIDISDGTKSQNKSVMFKGTEFSEDQYFVNDDNHTFACPTHGETEVKSEEQPIHPKEIILPKTMIISVIFLLATILVYSCLPELLNLLGKCLLCYLACLAVSFAFTAYIYMDRDTPDTPCVVVAYIIFFSCHSSFIWTNVLSFDLWSSFRATMGSRAISDKKRFYLYMLYVWGWSSLISIIAYVLDSIESVPKDFKPGFGTEICYLRMDVQILFRFFYLPLCMIFAINATLFTLSTMKIIQVQRELKRSFSKEEGFHRQNSSMDKKSSYMLFLRLMIVFGLTWFFEGISFVTPNHMAFLAFDILNSLQGFIIFLLFVMKARVRQLIKKKWQVWSGAIQDHVTSSIVFTSDSTPSNVNNNYRLAYIAQSKCPS